MSSVSPQQFRIYLVRHAHSSWARTGMRDFDRPLDPRGRDEAARLSGMMRVNGYLPSRVVCSPAARCAETLEILRPHLGADIDISFHMPLYAADCGAYLDVVAGHAAAARGALMIVGHNPMIDEAARALTRRDGGAAAEALCDGFPTGGLFAVDQRAADRPAADGHAHFVGLLSPVDA